MDKKDIIVLTYDLVVYLNLELEISNKYELCLNLILLSDYKKLDKKNIIQKSL